MAGFRRLNSIIQEAECAIYHAEALISAGERSDAKREIDWADDHSFSSKFCRAPEPSSTSCSG